MAGRSTLRHHALAFVLAPICGAIVFLPHIIGGFDSPYQQSDESGYAIFVETVRSGSWTYSDCFLWEHREDYWPFPRLPFWILGTVARAVGTEGLFRGADFVLPTALFLLAYALLVQAGLGRGLAILGASAYVLHFDDVGALLDPLTRYDVGTVARWYLAPVLYGQSIPGLQSVARLPDPLLSRVLLLGALWTTIRWVSTGRRLVGVVAAVLAGLTVYMRFFDWTIYLPALSLAAVFMGLARRRLPMVRLMWIVAGAGVVGVPYFLNSLGPDARLARDVSLPYSEFVRTQRLFPGVLQETYPAGPICLMVMLGVSLAVARHHVLGLVGTALSLACAAAVSHQVVTGWTIAPAHWYMHQVFPHFVLMVALLAGAAALRVGSAPWRQGLMIALIGLCIGHGAMQYATPARLAPRTESEPEIREALRACPPDAVVLSFSPGTLRRIDGRIWSYLPWTPYTTAPADELMERLLTACRVWGRPRSQIEELFDGPGTSQLVHFVKRIEHYVFRPIDAGSMRMGAIESIRLPPDQRDRWLEFYDALPTDRGALTQWIRSRYRLNYLLVPRDQDSIELQSDPNVQIIYTGAWVTLYALR